MNANRTLPWDWYPGAIPENVSIDETAYIETTYSFFMYRSTLDRGVRVGKGSSAYLGTMFDIGPQGFVQIGEFSLVNGAWLIGDCSIEIGNHTLISWNVVLMDSYRASTDPRIRRGDLESLPYRIPRSPHFEDDARALTIGSHVWIGFDVCVLPGVRIGDGCIIGAKSVVATDIPPYCIAAGNPARVVREIDRIIL
jgi:acetyltransferase-like isoleucine patch superfamily enzyme